MPDMAHALSLINLAHVLGHNITAASPYAYPLKDGHQQSICHRPSDGFSRLSKVIELLKTRVCTRGFSKFILPSLNNTVIAFLGFPSSFRN